MCGPLGGWERCVGGQVGSVGGGKWLGRRGRKVGWVGRDVGHVEREREIESFSHVVKSGRPCKYVIPRCRLGSLQHRSVHSSVTKTIIVAFALLAKEEPSTPPRPSLVSLVRCPHSRDLQETTSFICSEHIHVFTHYLSIPHLNASRIGSIETARYFSHCFFERKGLDDVSCAFADVFFVGTSSSELPLTKEYIRSLDLTACVKKIVAD